MAETAGLRIAPVANETRRMLLATLLGVWAGWPVLALAQSDPWWNPEWKYRAVVTTVERDLAAGINTAAVELDIKAKCAPKGQDVRVLNEALQFVPHAVAETEGGMFKVEFLVEGAASKKYFIYFGNPSAPVATHGWERKVGGLHLETRDNPLITKRGDKNARSLEHFLQSILSASTISYGKGPREQINDIENPFSGPDDMYISIYRGQIFCPESGEYGFATDSDDSSFLLIDGQLVAEFPGGHIPNQNWSQAGKKHLKRGVHEITYYHVESYGGQLARAGWKKPSEQEFSLIPAHAFIRELPCEILGLQERQKPVNAYFVAEERTALKINNKFLFPTFAFEDRSSSFLGKVLSYAWDFGDGRRSSARNPIHRFLDAGKYHVALTVTDSLGYTDTVSQDITVEAVDVTNFSVLFDVQTAENVIYPEEDVVLTLRLRSTATGNLPVTLSSTLKASAGYAIHHESEALTLEPGVFRTAVKRYRGRSGGCDAVFTLAYQGKVVAERTVRIVQTSDALVGIKVENENLVDESGNLVILKIARVASGRKRMKRPEAIQKIVVVDDSLSPMVTKGNEGATYYGMLKQKLARDEAEAGIELVRAGTSTDLSGYPPLVRLSKIHSEVVAQKPDLVLIACSITDILNYLPIDKFERYLTAAVDQILSQSDAEVVLIAPPPLIINPEISKAYAIEAKKVGLEKGIRVADMYTMFLLREEGLTSLYKDETEQDPVYYSYPNRKGQELIAQELYRKLFGRS